MTLSITTRFLALALAIILAFGLSLAPVFANEDDEETDHHTTEVQTEHEEDDTPRITQMKTLIALLTQLVELLQKQAGSGHDVAESNHHDDDEASSDELAVWIEIHSNQTHAHVQKPGEEADSFLLEDIHYTEEGAIIAAIAKKTGLSEHDIEEVIVFPSGEVNEHGDSMDEEEEHDEDDDLAGIHIMSDGKIMWGNGTEVQGATITSEGKILLSDGKLVEPKFDLR